MLVSTLQCHNVLVLYEGSACLPVRIALTAHYVDVANNACFL